MRILATVEAAHEVRTIIEAADSSIPIDGSRRECLVFFTDALNRTTHLARLMTDLIGKGQQSLLWFTEWGIWPSSENHHLFQVLRRSCGDERSIRDAPAHLFEAGEDDILISFLQMALISGWGGLLLGMTNHHRIIFSHDEWLSVHAADAARLIEHDGLTPHAQEQWIDPFRALGLDHAGEPLPPAGDAVQDAR